MLRHKEITFGLYQTKTEYTVGFTYASFFFVLKGLGLLIWISGTTEVANEGRNRERTPNFVFSKYKLVFHIIKCLVV